MVGEGCSTGTGAFSTGIGPAGSRSKEEGAKDISTSTSSLPSDCPAGRDFPNLPSSIAQVLQEEVRELRNLLPIRLVSRAHSRAEKAAEKIVGRGGGGVCVPWRLHTYKSNVSGKIHETLGSDGSKGAFFFFFPHGLTFRTSVA